VIGGDDVGLLVVNPIEGDPRVVHLDAVVDEEVVDDDA